MRPFEKVSESEVNEKLLAWILKNGYTKKERNDDKGVDTNGEIVSEDKLVTREDMAVALNCADNDESKGIKEKLDRQNLTYVRIAEDDDCMFNAIITSFKKEDFTAQDMRSSLGKVLIHILANKKDYEHWYGLLEVECADRDKSVVEYIFDLNAGKQWGDTLSLGLISHTHQLQIIVVTPTCEFTVGGQFSDVAHIIFVQQHYSATTTRSLNSMAEDEVTSSMFLEESVASTQETRCDTTTCDDMSEAGPSEIPTIPKAGDTRKHKKTQKAGPSKAPENYKRVDGKILCKVCDKVLATPRSARGHYDNIHEEKKRFKCKCCSKGFRFKDALKKHESKHENKREFTCGLCGKGFNTDGNRKRHEASCAKIFN